jgi:hypothetical protein
MKKYPLSSRCACQLLKMPKQLVNREEQGKLIAKTSGAILMINESNYMVRSKSGQNLVITLIPSLKLNLDRLVHVQIMLATIPNASM